MGSKKLCMLAVLGTIAGVGCHERIVLRPEPPARVSIILRTNPFTGDCVSATQPQLVQVYRGDAIIFEVVNVDCKKTQESTVQLRFKKSIIEFDTFDVDCEGASSKDRKGYAASRGDEPKKVCPVEAGKPTPSFKFRASGTAAFDEGRHKYDVLVDGKPVEQTGEDPELCGRKHCF